MSDNKKKKTHRTKIRQARNYRADVLPLSQERRVTYILREIAFLQKKPQLTWTLVIPSSQDRVPERASKREKVIKIKSTLQDYPVWQDCKDKSLRARYCV